ALAMEVRMMDLLIGCGTNLGFGYQMKACLFAPSDPESHHLADPVQEIFRFFSTRPGVVFDPVWCSANH
ncbi:MAG: hypothetical protein Q7J47_21805, partial [Azoarcus sp.]|nr:hypothetical protein [Azoarcus sp.]